MHCVTCPVRKQSNLETKCTQDTKERRTLFDWGAIICLICSCLEQERRTLTECWENAESARKFLQSEGAPLKGQREKLKQELQGVTDKMVYLRACHTSRQSERLATVAYLAEYTLVWPCLYI